MQSNPAKLERNLTIAERRLEGQTYRQLAAANGISKAQIHNILNTEQCRDVIATGTKQLISLVPKAIDNYRVFLSSEDKAIRYKASKDALQTVGILASHTDAKIINQYISNTQVNVLEPGVSEWISAKLDDVATIEADFEEV